MWSWTAAIVRRRLSVLSMSKAWAKHGGCRETVIYRRRARGAGRPPASRCLPAAVGCRRMNWLSAKAAKISVLPAPW